MKLGKLFKYGLRFLTLEIVITYFLIYFFNNFLISDEACEYCAGSSFRMQIENNLWEDRNRFFSFIDERFINLEIFIAIFVFLFLIILYSTKFYTYVNELTYSLDRSYLDEYFSIFLLWTSGFVFFLTLFRIANLISRGYLILLTFLIPLILLFFRNSEFLSSILGRSVTSENYISFNLEAESGFRNLRIMTFRNESNSFNKINLDDTDYVIKTIDNANKKNNLNLIILNFKDSSTIKKDLEKYLINLNKKIW